MDTIWLISIVLLVPILVHLFSFRKAKKHLFPTLKFINKVSTDSKSKTKLKHYLVLINRFVLFASLVTLLFVLMSTNWSQVSSGQRILVDNSLSMEIKNNYLSNANNLLLDFQEDTTTSVRHKNIRYFNSFNSFDDSFDVLISDFQGFSSQKLSSILIDSISRKEIYLVGEINSYENIYVDSLGLSINPDDFTQQSITIYPQKSVSLESGNVVIKLKQNGRQLSSVVSDVRELNKVVFDIPIDQKGTFTIEVTGDEVFYDNVFLFVISPSRKPVICLIQNSTNQYLKEVFANNNLFDLRVLQSNALDYDVVTKSDLVILSGLESFPRGIEEELSNKAVLVFPSVETNTSDLNQFFQIGVSTANTEAEFELDIDYNHPLLRGVFERTSLKSNTLPSAIPLFSIEGSFSQVISLRNGYPFLLKSVSSDHYLFNTVMSKEYTDLVSNSLFLPLMYQIALSTVANDGKTYYYPGDIVSINVDNKEIPPLIVGADIEIIPEFNPSGSNLSLKIPSDFNAGYYWITHDQDTVHQIAVNTIRSESIMEGLTIDELTDVTKDMENITVGSINNQSSGFTNEGKNGILKYALILSVLLLITETMLHRYL